jgi:hypothetical protein
MFGKMAGPFCPAATGLRDEMDGPKLLALAPISCNGR